MEEYVREGVRKQPPRPMTKDELLKYEEEYKHRNSIHGHGMEDVSRAYAPQQPYYDPMHQLKLLQLETINHALKLHRIIGNIPSNTIMPSVGAHSIIDHKLRELVILLQGRN